MKRSIIFFLFIIILSFRFYSQTFTNHTTYTLGIPNAGNNLVIGSVISGNSLFNLYKVYNSNFHMVFQKSNLNGTPILIKSYPLNFHTYKLDVSNGYLYVTGDMPGNLQNSVPYIAKIDTSNLNLISLKQIEVNTNLNTFVKDSKLTNNGNLLLSGVTWINGFPFGLFLGYDSKIDSVAYSQTLSVNGGSTFVAGATEISNSSVLFTGHDYNNQLFIGKATKTNSTFSVNSTYYSNCGLDYIDHIPGTHSALTYQMDRVFKIDTSLSLLNTAIGRDLNPFLNYSGHVRMYFIENKLYRLGNFYEMDVFDTTLATISNISYPFTANTFSSPSQVDIGNSAFLAKKNSNLYISFSPLHAFNWFYLFKTDLLGNMYCSNSLTRDDKIDVSNNSSSVAFNFGPQLFNLVNVNVSPTNVSVSYTDGCQGTLTNLKDLEIDNLNVSFDGQKYIIKASKAISEICIYDVSGKLIEKEVIKEANSALINLTDRSRGIYVCIAKLSDNSFHHFKLIN